MPETPEGIRTRLDELSRRLSDNSQRDRDTEISFRDRFHRIEADIAGINLLCSKLPDYERRLAEVEEQNIAVLVRDMRYLEKRVDSMARAWWTVAGGLILAVVTFALSVASGQLG